MSRARLTKIWLRNFKSFGPEWQEIELTPLTILVGRNNSGKSTILQSLLLLKQTLEHPRLDVQAYLQGRFVDARGLRHLTHGWPSGDLEGIGPEISLEWQSRVDVDKALATGARPLNRARLATQTGIPWLEKQRGQVDLTTTISLQLGESDTGVRVEKIELWSSRTGRKRRPQNPGAMVAWDPRSSDYDITYDQRGPLRGVSVTLEHMLPYLQMSRSASPAVAAQARGFRLLYEQPFEGLKSLLSSLRYVGSSRVVPSSIYRPASTPPDDVGISGEYAAQVFHARQREGVHFLPLPALEKDGAISALPSAVRALPLADAVGEIFQALGIDGRFRLDDIKDIGFELLFGNAPLQHVGRGISYLLPVVEACLIADPLCGQTTPESLDLDDYLGRCEVFPLIALEEPESHMHPKVQSRLAHLFISLARSGRHVIIETHSDHLVRRLRGMIARATPGSEAEAWLRDNVNIVQVEQSSKGVTTVKQSRLTTEGSIAEHWPADFMDEAPDEERAIYYAGMDKREVTEQIPYAAGTEFIEGEDDDEEAE